MDVKSACSSITMTTSVPAFRARHCCWTLNNYTETEVGLIQSYASGVRYLCYAPEIGESGTPHLQGYVAWDNPRSLEKFKKDCGGRIHYEPYTNGSAQQNRDYCSGMVPKKGMKMNPGFLEWGELPTQGSRTDWAAAIQQLRTDDIVSVIDAQPQLAPCIRALERYKSLTLKPLKRNVEVIVLIGKTGTGKSSWAYDHYPELYAKPDGQWFDGYSGQKTILLDDYYGSVSYPVLLKMCDRYPFNAPVKGGYVWAQWDKVIITSNASIESWYSAVPDISAFKRRITYLAEDYNHAYDNPPS